MAINFFAVTLGFLLPPTPTSCTLFSDTESIFSIPTILLFSHAEMRFVAAREFFKRARPHLAERRCAAPVKHGA